MWNPLVRFRAITLHATDSEIVAALVLLLAGFCAVYALVSLARGRGRTLAPVAEAHVHEEQHTTLSWQQLLQPLKRLRRRPRPLPLTAADLRSLRTIYRALLTWAARHGHAREPSTTPHELARRLSAQHPSKARALSELTDFYTQERYAERPCTDAEQERARTLLHELTR